MLGTSLYDTAAFQRRLWTPVVLRPKLALWLDAADLNTISSSSGVVDVWRDKSGKDRHATGLEKPAWTPGGWKNTGKNGFAVECSGNDRMQLATGITYSGANGISLHFAINNTGSATTRKLISGAGNSLELSITLNKLNFVKVAAADLGSSTAEIPTGHVIVGGDAATSRTDFWINGSVETTSANGTYTALTSILFRRGSTAASWFDSFVGEVIVTDFVLTAAESAQVQGYLAWKWGTVDLLPVSHLYKRRPPLIGT